MYKKEADQLLFLDAFEVLLDRNGLLGFIVKRISHFVPDLYIT